MHGPTKHLRLRFDDDFDDYPESINNCKNTSTASNPAPRPFANMSRRSKRRQRQRTRQERAAAASLAAMGMADQGGDLVGPIGLQYGEDDPIGFRTIEDGYIPMEVFPRFPKLPLELRREVWRRVLPEPQSIFITANGHAQYIIIGNIRTQTWVYRPEASYKVPRLLGVCHETRQEVMIYHRPCFAHQFGGVPVYYNPKTDLLHFDNPEALLHFYGGSAPNYLPRSLTNGYRWNMREFHTNVTQIAVGNVEASEGMLGAMFNQMKGLKVVLIENQLMRPEGETIMKEVCDGIRELQLGWEEYTVERTDENRVKFKLVRSPQFKEKIQGWTGRIISEEEEAAERAEEAEARLIGENAATQQQGQQSAPANSSIA
ncbi:hypothetical protein BKA61DRAFT_666563 [Leptodontidium sp. MPI-SDFR-AT-0119]|nr:hypothetical protein BKA61DRAFT_666563 [Leptodontidium sp. MPI-SDFR-AT-0119]